MKLPIKDPTVFALVTAAFSGARRARRAVDVVVKERHSVADYWDGGSRVYTRFVRLADLVVVDSSALPSEARQKAGNPFDLPIADVSLLPGYCIVEHIMFCGKDLGYRIIIHPDNVAKLLPSATPALPTPM